MHKQGVVSKAKVLAHEKLLDECLRNRTNQYLVRDINKGREDLEALLVKNPSPAKVEVLKTIKGKSKDKTVSKIWANSSIKK